MINVADITAANWSIDINSFGDAVQGIAEINQTIGLILETQKGSDPFRPNFGSDVWEYVGAPITEAGPNIVRAITDAITRWETRIIIKSITYVAQPQGDGSNLPAGLIFTITWVLVGGENVNVLNLLVGLESLSGISIIRILGTETGAGLITQSSNGLGI